MNNFEFQAPTKLIFADTISKVKDEIPKIRKILMTYGGGSIRKNGVYKTGNGGIIGTYGFRILEELNQNPQI